MIIEDKIQEANELVNECLESLNKLPKYYISRCDQDMIDNLKDIAIILDSLPERLEQEKQEWKEEYDEKHIKIQRMLKGPSWGMTKEEHQAIPLHKLFGDKWPGKKPDD